MSVRVESAGAVRVVTIDRPHARNAVDRDTADALHAAFLDFDADPNASVAVLAGAGGTFCAGADLKAIAAGNPNRVETEGPGPLGPTRMQLSKPVIAAIDGHAVAGGLELALWCDLRVADPAAVLGVFCRRFGVPLIDGGTIRLPRIIGLGRALDLILTGRAVKADEALQMGLITRVSAPGNVLEEAIELAQSIAVFPQICMRGDRASAYAQFDLEFGAALQNELAQGLRSLGEETLAGALAFAAGSGRGGRSRDE